MEHVEGALFLDAPMLLKHNQSVIASLVNGKNADELRALLGAGSDFDGAELEAALAESAFLPENYEAPQQLGAASSTAPHSKSTLDLLSAAEMGDHEALLKALKEGGDVSATDDKTMTALHWAARCGRPDDLKALLEAGASVNTATKAGVTALIYAASEGWDDCVPILLQAGADIAMPTNKGRTALQAAQEKAAKADAEERLRFDKTIRALASPVAARTAAPAAVVTPTQATASSAAPFTPLRQPSLAGVPATTDAREAALGMVGVRRCASSRALIGFGVRCHGVSSARACAAAAGSRHPHIWKRSRTWTLSCSSRPAVPGTRPLRGECCQGWRAFMDTALWWTWRKSARRICKTGMCNGLLRLLLTAAYQATERLR